MGGLVGESVSAQMAGALERVGGWLDIDDGGAGKS